jgi:hypothetical protein
MYLFNLFYYPIEQYMKRKIQHDAINNQEDEDSSAYPLYFPIVESLGKKKKDTISNVVHFFSTKILKGKDEVGQRRK